MSKPVSTNSKIHRILDAKRNRLRSEYISEIHTENGNSSDRQETKINIPMFNVPVIPKFESIAVPKIEMPKYEDKPVEQNNTLDDFEREYQAFIEKLKREKEKKELKEELKAFCKEYINELLGINQPQEEPEPEVKEPVDTVVDEPLFADVDEETTQEEPRNFEEEYQDFINSLKQSKKRK